MVGHQLIAANVEEGGGDVHRQVVVIGQDLIEDIGELVAVVVNDVGKPVRGGYLRRERRRGRPVGRTVRQAL
jgi:hypothetical protein